MVNSHIKYRPDIDGLRALAVSFVVIFHAFPEIVPGGFVGVDVFFVISGFLISSIILKDIDEEKFSIRNFYIRRIKRIFPALCVTLLGCFVFGLYVLLPSELKQLGLHIRGGGTFLSNYILYKENSYFDISSNLKPLLHLWSLAIEEQYYIIFPLLVSILYKTRRLIFPCLFVLTLVSFVLCVYYSIKEPVMAFYLPFTRFWEILLGALLAYLNSYHIGFKKNHFGFIPDLMSIVGVLFILSPCFLLSNKSSFPGYLTLFPTFGALFIICSKNSWINRSLFSNEILVGIGLISYPLYLTHWPLLSFFKIIDGGVSPISTRVLCIVVSALVSWSIYKYIEKPIRRNGFIPIKVAVLVCSLVLLAFIGQFTIMKDGFRGRSIAKKYENIAPDMHGVKFFSYISNNFFPCEPKNIYLNTSKFNDWPRCYQSKKDTPQTIAIVGDSHAEHFYPGLASAMTNENIVFYLFADFKKNNEPMSKEMLSHLLNTESIKTVFIANMWSDKLNPSFEENNNFVQTIIKIQKSGKKILLLSDVPRFNFLPISCAFIRPLTIGKEEKCMQKKEAIDVSDDILKQISNKVEGVRFVDIKKFLCNDNECSMKVNDEILYRDTHHLSIEGSIFIGGKILSSKML
ncbi:MAG: acyltransferase [Desulfobulbaceae bacterium]|nr:acyltransferase [Desulfobulbaceae bacterium]